MSGKSYTNPRCARGDKAVWVWITPAEQRVVEQLRDRERDGDGKRPSMGELCRIALAALADENDLEIPVGAFERKQVGAWSRRPSAEREKDDRA